MITGALWCPAGSPEDGGKPFQCPVCGLVIKRKSYWKRHMVIHTGLKSHQCPLCPFRCARKDNLKSHMKVRRQSTVTPAASHLISGYYGPRRIIGNMEG